MDTAQSTFQMNPRRQPPSLLVCVACRKKHLKCNGKTPICRRCQESGSECSYKQSSRGYKDLTMNPIECEKREDSTAGNGPRDPGSTANPATTSSFAGLGNWPSPSITEVSFEVTEHALPLENLLGRTSSMPYDMASKHTYQIGIGAETMSNTGKSLSTNNGGDNELTRSYQNSAVNLMARDPSETRQPTAQTETNALIDIYYGNFNSAHPFLIPRTLYRKSPALLPPHLKVVMQFVASHFVPGLSQERLRNTAENITSDCVPDDGFKTQGLILLGMSLYARFERDPAITIINQAIDLALDLGMNYNNFAIKHGMGNPIIEESWRRTWWELYMMDGILATLNNAHHSFRLQHVQNDVPLPCEEFDYAHCRSIPPLRTQSDFLGRTFATETYDYSSLAYKIEAVRLSGNVLALGTDTGASNNDQVQGVDASLASFLLSLPPYKRHIVEREGTIDEVLFSAHNIIDCALIMLHRPRSNLVFIKNHYPTHCTRQEAIGTPVSTHDIHTSKAMRAANAISNASALRTPLAGNSPCFVCAIALAAVVYLPAYSMEYSKGGSCAIRERLQLTISALNSIGETWPMAKAVRVQISQFAREIFSSHAAAVSSSQAEAQIQQIDIESMMDEQTWLDQLSYLVPGENAMMLESASGERFSISTEVPTVNGI